MKVSKPNLSYQSDYFNTDHLKSGFKKRAISGAGLVIFSQVASYGIQMFGVIILARLLIPEDFGLVAMVTSISGFFLLFRRLGLTDAIVQREEINHKQISTLFWINALFSLGLTLLLMSLSGLIAWFYGDNRLVSITIITSLGFVIGGLSTQHLALLKRNMQFFKFTVIEIGAAIVSVVVSVAIALFGFGYWALVARPLILVCSSTIGAWMFCTWKPGLPSLRSGVKPLLNFGMFYLLNNTVDYFSFNLDKVLVGWRYGSESLGFYSRAYYLFLAPAQQLSYPLSSVSIATLSRLVNEPERYRKYYLEAISMISFIAFPISTMLTITGKDVVLLMLGSQWGKAGEIFSILGIAIGIQMIYATQYWLHISQGRTDRLFRWGIFSAVTFILSFFIGLPFGSIGVATAYSAAIYCLIGPCLWYAGRLMSIKLTSIVLKIWKYYLAAFLSGLFCWFLLNSINMVHDVFIEVNIIARLIISYVLFLIVYLLLVIVFYQNAKPIMDFISVSRDMVPRFKR